MNDKTTRDAGKRLKRFQDALKGRRLSGIAAHEINAALSLGGEYTHFCEQDEKLQEAQKPRLRKLVDQMIAAGVKPAASLLTPCQKKAIARRRA